MFNEWGGGGGGGGGECFVAAEKNSILRNLTKHLGEMWITALKEF